MANLQDFNIPRRLPLIIDLTPLAEGRRIYIELIEKLQGMTGIVGVYLMGHQAEAQIAATLREGGFAIKSE